MKKLIWQILISTLAIFLATKIVSGVELRVIPGKSVYFGIELTKDWQILILVGTVLGLINFFVKPILDLITFPLKVLTLGFFSLILNMIIIFFLDVLFPELEITNFGSLFFTSLIVLLTNIFLKP